ncbi:MAG: hypothetical protein WDO69_01310 [Pseudomonadota bacterium]
MIGESAFQLDLEPAVIGGRSGTLQPWTQRDLGGLLAHQPFHVARELLIQAERFVEVRADVGDEEFRRRPAHGAFREPDRGQEWNQRGQDDRERQAAPNATGSDHLIALPRLAITLEDADQSGPGVEAEQPG